MTETDQPQKGEREQEPTKVITSDVVKTEDGEAVVETFKIKESTGQKNPDDILHDD